MRWLTKAHTIQGKKQASEEMRTIGKLRARKNKIKVGLLEVGQKVG